MRSSDQASSLWEKILPAIGLLLVLAFGAYFRFTGLMWGDYEYPHPDERFLVWVVADIAPVENISAYFDTAVTSLNPANRGHAFYVYGDFPVVMVRYVTEWLSETVGWEEILQVGRGLSAIFDLFTVLLVYLTAHRLSGWRVATLAGLFAAAAVLQIQQSHFFTVDSFAVTFTTLAVYLAVLIATQPDEFKGSSTFGYSILFGTAVGFAMACKLNTVAVAGLLPLALGFQWFRTQPGKRSITLIFLASAAAAGGIAAFIIFRLAQPYAFAGPGIFDIKIDEVWLKAIRDLSAQSAGDVDFPPALQWARRNHLFSLQNLTLWGLGFPLAALAWTGFFVFAIAAVQKIRNLGWKALMIIPWPGLFVVWFWTAFYFVWQSAAWNPTMRYQLPIYPTLSMLAAWVVGYAWNAHQKGGKQWRIQVGVVGGLVLLFTLAWAFAFTRMYTRTETRLASSHWIFEHIPGPINLAVDTPDGINQQIIPVPERVLIRPDLPYLTLFNQNDQGALSSIVFPRLLVTSVSQQPLVQVVVQVFENSHPEVILGEGKSDIPPGNYDQYEIPISGLPVLEKGKQYELSIGVIQPGASADSQDDRPFVSIQIDQTPFLRLYEQVQTYEMAHSSFELSNVLLQEAGTVRQVHVPGASGISSITVLISDPLTGEQQVSQASPAAQSEVFQLDQPMPLKADITYLAAVTSNTPGQEISPDTVIQLYLLDLPFPEYLPAVTPVIRENDPVWQQFSSQTSGTLIGVSLGYAVQLDPNTLTANILIELGNGSQSGNALASANIQIDSKTIDPRGKMYYAVFDQPVQLQEGQLYWVNLSIVGQGAAAVRGSALANETSWDMGLPFRTGGYDPFGGIYRSDLNFEMYWDDNTDKYQRFINIIDQADTILISSNRQWGTTTRLPERHPLTTQYYRALLGCPPEKDIIWCYNVAEVGTFQGQLGFDLVNTFTSYPNLGPVEINTQFAEEAFTVYDHPKVFVFQKRPDYDPARVRAVLGEVDLQKVVRITPKSAADFKVMLFPANLWKIQQVGGTWSKLFPPEGFINQSQWLAMAVWYIFLFVLGLIVYPAVRLAFPGLADKGYPLARIVGLLLLAYPVWLAGSLGVSVTRGLIGIVLAGLLVSGLILAYLQRNEIKADFTKRRSYFLRVELLGLILFAVAILIRFGNPDLWHPIFGGEKPMNFSQLNAVLKSTIFPPYDPWFAGGTLNYYYFGYVMVGMPVKLLGIAPAVAYNLILPGLFCMVGLAAFSIGWNLIRRSQYKRGRWLYWAGLAAVIALLIIGNLGTVRMVWEGLQKLVVSEEQIQEGGVVKHISWAVQGAAKLVTGEAHRLPYYESDWYWKPSRAIQPEAGNEITEFPYFTFLYGDLHAHLMALPLTLLVIAWSLSAVLVCGQWGDPSGHFKWLSFSLAIFTGALATGALRPANTWDQYTYLPLAVAGLFYGQWQGSPRKGRFWWALVPVVAFIGLSLVLFRPFDWWFGQGYSKVAAWEGAKTNLESYLVHWGLFLFVIAAWLVDETLDWMASSPLSSVNRLRPYRLLVWGGIVLIFVVLAVLVIQGIIVSILIIPLGASAVLLLLRPGQPLEKRAVLFMVGTALMLTLLVELVAVQGDINRMNTVFKFYFQAWSLFSLSAAAALIWLLLKPRNIRWYWTAWVTGFTALVIGAALYPVVATPARLHDRMAPDAPHQLDGMAYMGYATYKDGPDAQNLVEMDLSQDEKAIRWIQKNIPGSPVIVEANTPEYRHWGSRYTIYTGLPGVVGWNWHERQQRALTPDTWVYERIDAIHAFYRTTSRVETGGFLKKYGVRLIVVGQLEKAYYSGPGLDKFAQWDGVLWDKIYEEGNTRIYQVK